MTTNPSVRTHMTTPNPMTTRGILLRATTDTLIVQAAPEDIARYACPQPVELRPASMPTDVPTLYNAAGQPVAVVREVMVARNAMTFDDAEWSSVARSAAAYDRIGMRRVEVKVDWIASIEEAHALFHARGFPENSTRMY